MDHHARYEDSLPRRELDILTEDVTPVLHLFKFFAARDDSAVTLAPEGRQILAQCVSTGNGGKDRRAPERGGRTGAECFFRPVPGLANLVYGPRARALDYSLAPSGLREHFLGCGYAALWGSQSWLPPPFRRRLPGFGRQLLIRSPAGPPSIANNPGPMLESAISTIYSIKIS